MVRAEGLLSCFDFLSTLYAFMNDTNWYVTWLQLALEFRLHEISDQTCDCCTL